VFKKHQNNSIRRAFYVQVLCYNFLQFLLFDSELDFSKSNKGSWFPDKCDRELDCCYADSSDNECFGALGDFDSDLVCCQLRDGRSICPENARNLWDTPSVDNRRNEIYTSNHQITVGQ
jgi:hypothetical protein